MWADPDDPQFDAYRVSKILAERAAWDFMTTSGGSTEFTTVLPGAVFGPILSAENLGSVNILQDLLLSQPAGSSNGGQSYDTNRMRSASS